MERTPSADVGGRSGHRPPGEHHDRSDYARYRQRADHAPAGGQQPHHCCGEDPVLPGVLQGEGDRRSGDGADDRRSGTCLLYTSDAADE